MKPRNNKASVFSRITVDSEQGHSQNAGKLIQVD